MSDELTPPAPTPTCVYCGKNLEGGQSLYCSPSHKVLASRVKRQETERMLGRLGFTEVEVVNIFEAAGLSMLTKALTALGYRYDPRHAAWIEVNKSPEVGP